MTSEVAVPNMPREEGPRSAAPHVSASKHARELQADAHEQTPKERLSAYFTIAAAAFGLISDGCECCYMYDDLRPLECSHFSRPKQSHDDV